MPDIPTAAGPGGPDDAETPAIPAATVILLRDQSSGLQTLMVRRSARLQFGGMWVFPGGRIDPDDYPVGASGDELGAARRGGGREGAGGGGAVGGGGGGGAWAPPGPPAAAPRGVLPLFFVPPAPRGSG